MPIHSHKPLSVFYIVFHLFLLLWAFLLLQFVYAQIHNFLFAVFSGGFWGLFWDRLSYGFVFLVGGFGLYFYTLPRLFPGFFPLEFFSKSHFQKIFFQTRKKTTNGLWNFFATSLWSGFLGGGFLFAFLLFLQWAFVGVSQSEKTIPLGDLGARLFLGACLTAIFEESFYRACLVGYLAGVFGIESTEAAAFCQLSKAGGKDIGFKGCFQKIRNVLSLALLFFPAILFAWVHPKAPFFMLAAGGLFTFLYWKRGLLASILAHAVYNALILLATAYQISF